MKACFGVMVAARGDRTEPVPLDKVAGKRKIVAPDHSVGGNRPARGNLSGGLGFGGGRPVRRRN